MYQFQVISNSYIIFCSQKYDSFVELVNNTDFDFDYSGKHGYEVLLYKNSKLLNILRWVADSNRDFFFKTKYA